MSKFPFYKQLDGMDCGPSCLRMIAKYYGKTFSVQQLREQSYIQRTGVNLLGISEAAASIGLRATGIRTSMEKLKQQSKLPCIIHWNQEHFVVLYKIEKKRGKTWFYIADPAYGLLKYEEQELKKCWISTTQGGIEKGIALLLDVTPQFYEAEPIKYEKLSLWYLFHYVRPYKKAMIQLIIGLLAGSLLQLVFPFLTQTIVDQGIGHRNLNFIQLILVAQLMLVFSRTLIEVIRRCILLHISTRVNVSLISDFLSKLMRLPMRFFDSKLAGDLIRRIEDHNRIESFLTQSVLNILFSTLTVVIFGIVLAIYSWKIFLIFILFSAAYMGWVKLFMRKRADLNRKNFEQMSVNQNNLMQLIYGMQDIKLLGCEQQKRWEWENIQASLFRINMSSLNLGQWQQVGAVLINEVKNVLITVLSATAVLHGSITLGVMLSIQYIIGQMQGPISQFVSFMQDTQDAQLSLERLGEIHGKRDRRHGPGYPNIRQRPDSIAKCSLYLRIRKIETHHQRAIAGHTSRKDYRHRGPQRQWENNADKTDARILSSHRRSGDDRQSVATKNQFQGVAQTLWSSDAGGIHIRRYHCQQHSAGWQHDRQRTPAVCRRDGKYT